MQGSPSDFLRDMIRADVAAGKHGGKVVTRFPPEPNGHLHIGHAKAICIDFGIAEEMGGRCHLRMDDTNPTTEDVSYVEAIKRDVNWLGFKWGEHLYYASDYFERFYELAEKLVRLGRAYVCDLPEDEFSQGYRGTITEAGKESPYRTRSAEESLDLLRRMRKGEFKDGEKVLRAKIDMASPNMKMRDPALVRIKHAHHYRTGDAWCIYPLYDYAHCLEDSFEGVTHSLCTMEFESARELYDWVIRATEVPHVPRQTEFARLNLTYTVMSKRRLLQLVEQKLVSGWDDPRMPTLAGLRRRGYRPEAIRDFCAKIGVAKNISTVDVALLESCVRDDLDPQSPRVMCILRPLELIIESVPEAAEELLDADYWPAGAAGPGAGGAADGKPRTGSRKVPFTRTLLVDREDFSKDPPSGWKRLAVGRKVRLRHGPVLTCTRVEPAEGEVERVFCTHEMTPTASGLGTIHWVSAKHAKDVEVRLYDRLFKSETPGGEGREWLDDLNPESLSVLHAKAEPVLGEAKAGDRFQFERVGFFVADEDSRPGTPIFNRTVPLKDGWAKVVARVSTGTKDGVFGEHVVPVKPKTAYKPAAAGTAAPLTREAKTLQDEYRLTTDEARVLHNEPLLHGLFLDAIANVPPSEKDALDKAIVSVIVNDLLGEIRARKLERIPFAGEALVELVMLGHEGTISTKQAKDVLAEMVATGKSARSIAAAKGMKQIASADALGPIVDDVLGAHADVVARYRGGNVNVLGALVGMVMKETKGQGNPKIVADLVKQRLG